MEINYKKLAVLPALMAILSAVYLLYVFIGPGFNMDVDLKGGTELVLEFQSSVDSEGLEKIADDFGGSVRTGKGIGTWTVFFDVPAETDTEELLNRVRDEGYDFSGSSEQTVGPALGASFLQQAILSLFLAFIFMSAVVFVLFRMPLPSFYMVFVAVLDILETLALSQVIGIKLSLATFAGLLLLIGYSVDTDVLLTTRVLKRRGEGTVDERLEGARKTGLTMTGTTLAALVVLFIAIPSSVIQQISSILIIGLIFDLINTWIVNAGLIRWFVHKIEAKL